MSHCAPAERGCWNRHMKHLRREGGEYLLIIRIFGRQRQWRKRKSLQDYPGRGACGLNHPSFSTMNTRSHGRNWLGGFSGKLPNRELNAPDSPPAGEKWTSAAPGATALTSTGSSASPSGGMTPSFDARLTGIPVSRGRLIPCQPIIHK